MSFPDRARLSLFEVLRILLAPSSAIKHLIANGDGTYSVMSHINCEWCDYCEADKDAQHIEVGGHSFSEAEPFEPRPDPYTWPAVVEDARAAGQLAPDSIHTSGECPCAKCAQQRRQAFACANAWETASLIVRDILLNVQAGHADDDARAAYTEWIAYHIAAAFEEQSLKMK